MVAPLLTNMTSLKSVPIQFCRCETFIEGKIYKEDGNPELASSQDWPPLQNTIQFWEEHYFINPEIIYSNAFYSLLLLREYFLVHL